MEKSSARIKEFRRVFPGRMDKAGCFIRFPQAARLRHSSLRAPAQDNTDSAALEGNAQPLWIS